MSGGFSAIIAGAVTCPLDVIKTRLQTQNITAMTQIIERNNPHLQRKFFIKFEKFNSLPLLVIRGII